jgi:NAD(P)H-nitrite reductase large subunit
MQLQTLEVTEVNHLGLGDRVCVDTCSHLGLLRTGEEVPSGLLRDAGGAVPTPLPDDPRATVCCCHGVTVGELREAIERDGLETVADVGASTRATTGCGSCRVEMQELLAKQA